VEEKPDVGGYFDPNYEVMLGLEPDLVLVLPEHDQVKEHLRALQVPMLQVSHADLDGVMASFGTIGEACGAAPRADEVAASIRAEMERVERATAGLARPKVLLLVGRTHGVGHIEDPYIVGNEGFYDELIRIAGGTNVYEGEVRFPSVSGEGLLHMDPDVIVDLVPDLGALSLTEEQLIADWDALPGLRAVQTGRVHVLEGDHVMIPGPRFPRIIEDLTALLHPELDLDGS